MASDLILSHMVAVNYTHASKTTVVDLIPNTLDIEPHNSGRKSSVSVALLMLSLVMMLLCTVATDVWQ